MVSAFPGALLATNEGPRSDKRSALVIRNVRARRRGTSGPPLLVIFEAVCSAAGDFLISVAEGAIVPLLTTTTVP